MPPSTGYASASTQTPPGSGLSSFTLIVDLADMPASWWAEVDTSDGTRGRVYKSDGTTELAVDWIDFDDTGETGWARILYSGTLTGTGQGIRIYPPNTGNAAVAAGDTYGQYAAYDGNWEGYWPLHDLNDRTSNANNMTAFNTPTSGATGQVGDCYAFDDAASEYLQSSTAAVTAAPATFMGWYNTDDAAVAQVVVCVSGGVVNNRNLRLQLRGPASDEVSGIARRAGTIGIADASVSYSTGTWQHAAYVETSSSSRTAYLNGGNSGSDATTVTPDSITVTNIGANDSGGSIQTEFSGSIDDVQIHSTARHGDWIDHEYDQTSDNSTFWGTWSWNAPAGGDPEAGLIGGKLINGGLLMGGLLVR